MESAGDFAAHHLTASRISDLAFEAGLLVNGASGTDATRAVFDDCMPPFLTTAMASEFLRSRMGLDDTGERGPRDNPVALDKFAADLDARLAASLPQKTAAAAAGEQSGGPSTPDTVEGLDELLAERSPPARPLSTPEPSWSVEEAERMAEGDGTATAAAAEENEEEEEEQARQQLLQTQQPSEPATPPGALTPPRADAPRKPRRCVARRTGSPRPPRPRRQLSRLLSGASSPTRDELDGDDAMDGID